MHERTFTHAVATGLEARLNTVQFIDFYLCSVKYIYIYIYTELMVLTYMLTAYKRLAHSYSLLSIYYTCSVVSSCIHATVHA